MARVKSIGGDARIGLVRMLTSTRNGVSQFFFSK